MEAFNPVKHVPFYLLAKGQETIKYFPHAWIKSSGNGQIFYWIA